MSPRKYLIFFSFIAVLIVSVFSFFPSQAFATDGWTARISAGSRGWYSITSSSDGSKLAAVSWGGYIYTSTDSGVTWTERTSAGSRNWRSIISSSDGTKLAVAVQDGYIFTSTDSGSTWVQRTSAGSRGWNSIASSSDGTKLVAGVYPGYIYTSTDSGATWTQRTSAGSRYWDSVASSSDGTKLAAVVNGGYIYTSIDSGVTWTEQISAGSRNWNYLTSSSDGTKLVAVVDSSGKIYTSSDSGATWIERTSAGSRYWMSIASSSDGTKLVAVTLDNSYIYTSADSGVTWTEQTSAGQRNWYSITSSSDGTKLAAVAINGYIYTYGSISTPNLTIQTSQIINSTTITLNGFSDTESTTRGFEYGLDTNYGQTTTENGLFGLGNFSATISSLTPGATYHYRAYATNSEGTGYSADSTFAVDYKNFIERTSAGSRYWFSITSSSDGTKLAAGDFYGTDNNGGYIYTSTDSGATWIQRTSASSRKWRSITSSSDGTKLAAVVGHFYNSGYIYTSTDSGATWTERTSAGSRSWTSISSSSDGTKLAAVAYSGYIYTSTDSGATWTERTSAGSGNWASITSSSDGTKLAAGAGGDGYGYIYTSTDSGATWTQRTSVGSRRWWSITSSSDGTKLAAGVYWGGYIYTSNDSGATWTEQTSIGSHQWGSIISSSDGTKLAAVAYSGYIYTSTDSGVTWTEQTSVGSHQWYSITSSSDGTKIAGGGFGDYIYTYAPPTAPSLTTDSATSVNQFTSTLNGTITSTGGVNPTVRGFNYGIDTNYGTNTIENGDFSTGAFSSNLTGLTPNTTYHYRSYATNTLGTSYGPDQTFTTLPISAPVVETHGETNATFTTATLNASITNDGGSSVTERGFEYGPTTSYGTTVPESGNFSLGSFSTNLTNLTPNTLYHYRAYATNSTGTTYGSDLSFTSTTRVWTERTSAGSLYWHSVASSSDGTKLAAGTSGGYIYTSIDSGETWTERTSAGSRSWSSITSSSDGTKLVAGVNGGYIYTSTDSGVTWTEQTSAGLRSWYSITSSSDGTKLAAVVNGGYIYTSNDSGSTWTAQTILGSRDWQSNSITSSADGTKLAAIVWGGYIYTSTDSGVAWTAQTSAGQLNWNFIASSSDGTKLVAGVWGGYIYTSTDSGSTWTERTSAGSRNWESIASSSDGIKLISGANNDYIYTSTDSGVTWTEQTSAGSHNWISITSSSDGTKLAAVDYNGYIYTYGPPSAPTLTTDSSSVTSSTSTLNGAITSTGGENSTVRGFNYGIDTNYGTNTTENGNFDTGSFSSNLTNLACETTYHYRSYATNLVGTGYGEDMTFTTGTCPTILSVTTDPASSITPTTVVLNSTITDDGGEVATRGFNYGLDTTYGTDTIESGSFYNGTYTKNLSSLTCNTTYHYRAYSTNYAGTSNGEDATFTTSPCSTLPSIVSTTPEGKSAITVTVSGNTGNYYIENVTKGNNSGWTTNTTHQSTNLTCNTEYSFRVKGKSADNIETDWSATQTILLPCIITEATNGSATITTQQDFENGDLENTLNSITTPGDLSLVDNTASSSVSYLSKWGSSVNENVYGATIKKNITFLDWQENIPLPNTRLAAGSGIIDGKIYIAGGTGDEEGINYDQNAFDSTVAYDPTANTYEDKAPMNVGRHNPASGVIDGKLYVAGGRIRDLDSYDGTSTAEVYDPALDSWTTLNSMTTPRIGPVGGADNGKFYVIGGAQESCGGFESSGEVYDPETNSWSDIAPAPMSKIASATGEFINGKLYIAGGQGPSECNNPWSGSMISYDPETDSWDTSLAQMPYPRAGGSSAVIDGKFYYIGGTDNEYNATTDIFVYDPITDSWTTHLGALPTFLHRTIAQIVGDELFLIGGRTDTEGHNNWVPVDTNYKINKSEFDVSSSAKKITKITWTATTSEGNSLEMFYSLDGNTFVSLGTTPGTYDLPEEVNNYLTYEARMLSDGNAYPSLDSLTLTYTEADTEHQYEDINIPSFNFIQKYQGQFSNPNGIATDSNNNVYVTDSNVVQKFTSDGIYITEWGNDGSLEYGGLHNPTGIAIDHEDNVYVVDQGYNRVLKFTPDGEFLALIGQEYTWGNSFSSDDGRFNNPTGVAIDKDNNIYVSDTDNYRIEKFDSNGNFLIKWGEQPTTFSGTLSDNLSIPNPWAWQEKEPLTIPRMAAGSGVIDGKIYIAGGNNTDRDGDIDNWENGFNTLLVYNPSDNSWDESKASMSIARTTPLAEVVDGKLYVIGGRNSTYDNNSGLSSIEVYDPNTDTWDTSKASMSVGRIGPVGGVYEGKIYVVGGAQGSCTMNSQVSMEVYNPLTDTWETKSSAPVNKLTGATAQFINGIMYVAGGQYSCEDNFSNTIISYNPTTDTWNTNLTKMPGRRAGGASFVDDGKFYYVGGTVETEYNSQNDIFAYDPVTNTWQTYAGSLFEANHRPMVQMVGDDLYIIGGRINISSGGGVAWVSTTANYMINKSNFGVLADSQKTITAITWEQNIEEGETLELLYSIDGGKTYTSLGTTPGTYPIEGAGNSIFYKAIYNSSYQISDANALSSLTLTYSDNGSSYEYQDENIGNNFYTSPSSQGGELSSPRGLEVDSSGNVYVTDYFSDELSFVKKFTSDGEYITSWGGVNSQYQKHFNPIDIAVDSQGNIHIVDNYYNIVNKSDSEGNLIFHYGDEGTGDGEFNSPQGIAIDTADNVYIVDKGNNRIQKFEQIAQQSGYQTPGTFTSTIINAGKSVKWTTLSKDENIPSGTSITYQTRTGGTAIPDNTWSEWQDTTGTISSPNNQYIQVKITLETTNTDTPTLHSITVNYENIIIPTSHSSSGSVSYTPPKVIPVVQPISTESKTITISSPIITTVLKLKSTGEDVKQLQTYLNTLGYNTGTPDGSFGPKTLEAIKKFQKDHALTPDGIVGPKTIALLNTSLASSVPTVSQPPAYTTVAPITTTPTSPTKQTQPTNVLYYGGNNNDIDKVREIQQLLTNKGYDTNGIDGFFGKGTLSAVKKFQADNGLTPDGIVGPKTRERMKLIIKN